MIVGSHLIVEIAPGGEPGDPDNWVWQDITELVRHEDGIAITYGRRDESSRVSPSTCNLRVDNEDGDFIPDNPLGQWYGDLDLGTPLRVRWDDGANTGNRFVGLLNELPTRWDKTGEDCTAPIVAAGIFRRVLQLDDPAHSALRRQIMTGVD